MKRANNIIANLFIIVAISLLAACNPSDVKTKLSLSCGPTLSVVENGVETIEVSGGGEYHIDSDNMYAECSKNGSIITVTGVKVGQCVLVVTAESGEKATCTITIGKSAAQKDFLVFATPRVENWLDHTVDTETTEGMQVTCEQGIDAAGRHVQGYTTYGFYNINTGDFCRLSALGNFSDRGEIPGGILAIGSAGSPTQYYLCERVEVVNILNGKVWIEASFSSRSDIRIVTEQF